MAMGTPGTRFGSSSAAGAQASASRAAIYLRVSTGCQAEQDLSIPDQRAQTKAWVKQRGWSVVAEYVEPGASATDDKRPEFQRMVERGYDGESAFDVIVVHSFSRFFRDAFGLEFYVRKLAKHGVRLERAKSGTRLVQEISPIVLDRFARTMREKLTTGDIPFRKALLGSLIDRVEVDDREVRIVGREEVLEQAVLASRQGQGGVHSFVPKWRPRQDLNLRPSD